MIDNNKKCVVKGMVKGMDDMPLTSGDAILDRMKLAFGVQTDSELSIKIGLTRQNVGNARKRNVVPSAWFLKVHDLTGVSLDWLRTGIESGEASVFVSEEKPSYGPQLNKMSPEWNILGKAHEILSSDSIYKTILLNNINVFYESLNYQKEITFLKERVRILELKKEED